MNFAVVFVILAIAFTAEASIYGWGPTLAVHGPAGPHAPVAIAAPGIATSWGHAGWGPAAWGPAAYGHGAWGPAAWAASVHAPAPAAITAHAGVVHAGPVGHEGSYVAKTRGAVHVAPLAGHANSAASINLQPAPGTV